jgi:hypothetical protein
MSDSAEGSFGAAANTSLDFEAMMSALLGMAGAEVRVTVEDSASWSTLLSAPGVMRIAEIEDAATDDERILFNLGDVSPATFVIERCVFHRAAGDDLYLEIELGGSKIYVDRGASAPKSS